MGTPNRQNFDAVLNPKIQIFGCPKWPSKFWQITWFWPFKIPCLNDPTTTHFWPSKHGILTVQNRVILTVQNPMFWWSKNTPFLTTKTIRFEPSKSHVLNGQNFNHVYPYDPIFWPFKTIRFEPSKSHVLVVKNARLWARASRAKIGVNGTEIAPNRVHQK